MSAFEISITYNYIQKSRVKGASVIVIENIHVVVNADHVVEMLLEMFISMESTNTSLVTLVHLDWVLQKQITRQRFFHKFRMLY